MRGRAAALTLLLGAALTPSAAADALQTRISVTPRPALFGDVIHATIAIDGSVEATVQGGFAPFRVLRSSSSQTPSRNGVETTWRFDLQCLEAVCAPGPGRRTVKLAPVRIRAGSMVQEVQPPSVVVAPRVTARQVANPEASFLHPTAPVGPTYRVAPGTARRLLVAAAALLVLVALALLGPLLRSRRRYVPADGADALARALALVRASRARPVPDRRRALELLARTLRRRDRQSTARASADLAWSEQEPDSERITELADRVERGAS